MPLLTPYTVHELTDILVHNLKNKVPDEVEIDDETTNWLYTNLCSMSKTASEALTNQAGDML